MPLALIEVTGGSHAITGQLRRRLTEIKSGVFVGKLSSRNLQITWRAVEEAEPKSAVLVYAHRNENGFLIRTIGQSDFITVDSDGLQLVAFRKKRRSGVGAEQRHEI